MIRPTIAAVSIALLLPCLLPAQDYYPNAASQGGWRALVQRNSTPSSAGKNTILQTTGVNWDVLKQAWNMLSPHGGNLLVIRNGWIVGDWGDPQPIHVGSCTKSMTSIAMARLFDLSHAGQFSKTISPDDPAHWFLPASWGTSDPARQNITVRQLLTMSSGLDPYDTPMESSGYLNTVLSRTVEAAPDTVWAYSSTAVDLLSLIVEDVSGQKLGDFFHAEVGSRIGTQQVPWGDMGGHDMASAFSYWTAKELARVAYLLLRNGAWNAGNGLEQVLAPDRVAAMTHAVPELAGTTFRNPNFFTNDPESHLRYGQLFWTNSTSSSFVGPSVPTDAYYMAGFGTNICMAIPSLDMVIVRLGQFPRPFDDSLVASFTERIVQAAVAPLVTGHTRAVGPACDGVRPTLHSSRPILGQPMELTVSNHTPGLRSLFLMGVLLDAPLTMASGCQVHIDVSLPFWIVPLPGGANSLAATIKNNTTWIGSEVGVQAFVNDLTASSNAVRLIVGQ